MPTYVLIHFSGGGGVGWWGGNRSEGFHIWVECTFCECSLPLQMSVGILVFFFLHSPSELGLDNQNGLSFILLSLIFVVVVCSLLIHIIYCWILFCFSYLVCTHAASATSTSSENKEQKPLTYKELWSLRWVATTWPIDLLDHMMAFWKME